MNGTGEHNLKQKLARFLNMPNIACSPSYVDYRSKTNAVILLDMGHTLGENVYRRNGEKKKT
jgi:hypothetical protein